MTFFTSFFNCMLIVHYLHVILVIVSTLKSQSAFNMALCLHRVLRSSFRIRPQLTSLNLHDYKGQQLWPLGCGRLSLKTPQYAAVACIVRCTWPL